MHTIQALIFALLVDVVEVAQHLDCCDVRARVIDNAFTAVLHQIFEKLQSLIHEMLTSPYAGYRPIRTL